MANYDMFSINAPWVCPFRETFHASQNSVPVVKRRKGCVPSRRSVADEIRCIFELFLWVWHAAIMSSPELTGYKMCHRQNVMKRLQFAFAWKSFLHRCCYFFYVISLWAAVGGTETANLCNRYRHWDMQMMRWIFVVAATFLFHFFFSDKTERCRLYLNECRRYKNIQATNGANCATPTAAAVGKEFAQIKLRIFDERSTTNVRRSSARGRRPGEGHGMTFEILK